MTRSNDAVPCESSLALSSDGAKRFHGAAETAVADLCGIFADIAPEVAGTQLFDAPSLRPLIDRHSPIGRLAVSLLGASARPVRAILFDKSASANWSLGWHQDRVIAVRSKIDVPGFGPWSVKQGVQHVGPPWEFLRAMITLRVHLDPVTHANAPLLVAPGSHRDGIIATHDVAAVVARQGIKECLAELGDVWAYATPILHASGASKGGSRRRVLQVDYAAFDLPGGLEWQGL